MLAYAADALTITQRMIAGVVVGGAEAFFSPADTLATKTVVPAEDLSTAMSAMQGWQGVTGLVGPPFGGSREQHPSGRSTSCRHTKRRPDRIARTGGSCASPSGGGAGSGVRTNSAATAVASLIVLVRPLRRMPLLADVAPADAATAGSV